MSRASDDPEERVANGLWSLSVWVAIYMPPLLANQTV